MLQRKNKLYAFALAVVMTFALVCSSAYAAIAADTTWYNSSYDTFTISTKEQLFGLAQLVNSGNKFFGKTIELGDNIDLANEAWTPIGAKTSSGQRFFEGTFDGKNHTIKNLNVNGEVELGLFGYLAKGAIKNLNMEGVTITGNHAAGSIVGTMGFGASIENCHAKNVKITLTPDYSDSYDTESKYDNGDDIGGIAGIMNDHDGTQPGSIKYCTVENAQLKGYRDIGGVVGTVNNSKGKLSVTNSTATKVSITVDQVTGYYGDKPENAGSVMGRDINNTTSRENGASEIAITVQTTHNIPPVQYEYPYSAPKTGDNSNLMLWVSLMIAAGCGMFIVSRKRLSAER